MHNLLSSPLILVIAAVVVIILIVGAILLIRSSGKKRDEETSAAQAQAPEWQRQAAPGGWGQQAMGNVPDQFWGQSAQAQQPGAWGSPGPGMAAQPQQQPPFSPWSAQNPAQAQQPGGWSGSPGAAGVQPQPAPWSAPQPQAQQPGQQLSPWGAQAQPQSPPWACPQDRPREQLLPRARVRAGIVRRLAAPFRLGRASRRQLLRTRGARQPHRVATLRPGACHSSRSSHLLPQQGCLPGVKAGNKQDSLLPPIPGPRLRLRALLPPSPGARDSSLHRAPA